MDVLVLIDKLDALVRNAKQVPLRSEVRVDKEELSDLLNELRETIPEELKEARWIVNERDEMLAAAKREAERILGEARERQTQLVVEHHPRERPSSLARTSSTTPAPRSARFAWAPRTTPTRSQHPRGQPLQVHRRHPARPRTPRGLRRTGRSRVTRRRPAEIRATVARSRLPVARRRALR